MENSKREKARNHIQSISEMGLGLAILLIWGSHDGHVIAAAIIFLLFYYIGVLLCGWGVVGSMIAENTFKPLINILEYEKLIDADAARKKARKAIIFRTCFVIVFIILLAWLSIAAWKWCKTVAFGFAYGMVTVFLMNCMETIPGKRIENMQLQNNSTDRNEIVFKKEYKRFFVDEKAAWSVINAYLKGREE